MSNPSKAKGNGFEREVVQAAQTAGLTAQRAWCSDGRSLGVSKDTDVLIGGRIRVQCKRRAQLPEWIKPGEGVDATVVREDRGTAYVVVPLDTCLRLLLLEEPLTLGDNKTR